jgi:hypothetical protein
MPSHNLNDTDIASQTVFLHSNDAIVSISDAEKIFYLNQSIIAPAGTRLLVGLTNMTFPNTIYNITDESNSITISGTEYTIEPGNYSASKLETSLSAAITSIGSVTFDTQNNVFKFTFSEAQTIQSSTMERQLGLKGQLPTGSSTSHTANNICDLGGATNIYVRIRNITINNLDSRGRTSNIIASIVNNCNFGSYIFYVPPEVLYYQIAENTISHLDIELTDQEGKLLDLNGADYNITLTFHYVKQRESSVRASLLKQIKNQYEGEEKTENEENKNVA